MTQMLYEANTINNTTHGVCSNKFFCYGQYLECFVRIFRKKILTCHKRKNSDAKGRFFGN